MFDKPSYGPWHTWYAWFPVKTDWHGWRWLCHVKRRMWRGGPYSGWDYRPIPQCDVTIVPLGWIERNGRRE